MVNRARIFYSEWSRHETQNTINVEMLELTPFAYCKTAYMADQHQAGMRRTSLRSRLDAGWKVVCR